jgi:hypothetical protein
VVVANASLEGEEFAALQRARELAVCEALR